MTQQVVNQNILNNNVIASSKSGMDYGKSSNVSNSFESVLEKADKTIVAEKKLVNSETLNSKNTLTSKESQVIVSKSNDTESVTEASSNTTSKDVSVSDKDDGLIVESSTSEIVKSSVAENLENNEISHPEISTQIESEVVDTSGSNTQSPTLDLESSDILPIIKLQDLHSTESLVAKYSELSNSVDSENVKDVVGEIKNKISELVSQLLADTSDMEDDTILLDSDSVCLDLDVLDKTKVLESNISKEDELLLDDLNLTEDSESLNLLDIKDEKEEEKENYISNSDLNEEESAFAIVNTESDSNAGQEEVETTVSDEESFAENNELVDFSDKNELINKLLSSVFADKLTTSTNDDKLIQLNQLAQNTSIDSDVKLEILNSLLESSDIRVSDVLIDDVSTDVDLNKANSLLLGSVDTLKVNAGETVDVMNTQVQNIQLVDSKSVLSLGLNLSNSTQDFSNMKQSATTDSVNTIIIDATEDAVIDVDTDVINVKDSKNAELKIDLMQDLMDEFDLEISTLSQSNTSSNGGSGFLGQQSSQEQLMKMAVTEQLNPSSHSASNSFDKIISSNSSSTPKDITKADIMAQIQSKLDGSNIQHQTKLTMVLNPESLGKVSIELVNTKEGMIAQMTVASSEVKELLDKSIDGLKSSLAAQGVNVENVSVKTAESVNQELDYTEQESNEHSQQQKDKQNRDSDSQSETFEDIVAKGLNKDEVSETTEA